MFECAILGDSIAVGVSYHLPQCFVNAEVGINSKNYTPRILQLSANHVLISLGSNDPSNMNTLEYLIDLRKKITTKSVTWLLSANQSGAHKHAQQVAELYGDRTISLKMYVGNDGVHPTVKNYKILSETWRKSTHDSTSSK